MTDDQREKLKHIVESYARRDGEIADIREAQKDLTDAGKEIGIAPKVVKQLAKERRMDDLERQAQLHLEHSLDACRLALGMLADMPLGEAAEALERLHRAGATVEANCHNEPQAKRGRPKGSRNRSKDEAPPAIPDEPALDTAWN